MQRPHAPAQPAPPAAPSTRVGWLPSLLVLAALATIAVGGLSTRLGPRWARRVFFRAPAGIVIHHTATGARVEGKRVDAALIGTWHDAEGFAAEYRGRTYHIGYHYVILPDGAVQRGRPDWMLGAHARGHNDDLGVCLVGNFDSGSNPNGSMTPAKPTQAQIDALVELLGRLLMKYRLRPEDVYRHSDLAPTACPGDRFPMEQVLRRLRGKP